MNNYPDNIHSFDDHPESPFYDPDDHAEPEDEDKEDE